MPESRSLPYDMGNAGDLLKHGVLAEILRHRLTAQSDQSIRFLDLFGGEPVDSNTPDAIVRRVGKLSNCALPDGQPDIVSGRYYGSGTMVRKLGQVLGGHVSVFVSDCDEGRRKRLLVEGLQPLEEAFPRVGRLGYYDAYRALESIRGETTGCDLILFDPFDDFLKPDRSGLNRAEGVIPVLSHIAKSSAVVLFGLNKDPFNRMGRRFDELLQIYFADAFIMTCPPIRESGIVGESKYYADVVLAGPELVDSRVANSSLFRRLERLANKLAEALELSDRGRMMLLPRTIGSSRNSAPSEGDGEMAVGRQRKILSTAPKLLVSKSNLSTSGRSFAGIDGCSTGWVMVRCEENGRFEKPVIVDTLNEIPPTDSILIDIPIGLPDQGRRKCDLSARKALGNPRCRSVFTGARRPLLDMENRESAHAWGKKQDGLGVSQQLWAIFPKIREVDAWITQMRQGTLREGHPELSFRTAAGRSMKHNKKTKVGQDERLNALAGFIDREMVCEWLIQTQGDSRWAADDILDALALCWSAKRLLLGSHGTLPTGDAPKDRRGLPMEMVF